MKKEFKSGDKVFHTRLKKYGVFVAYSKLSDNDAIVEFIDEYGYEDIITISVCFLKKGE